MLVGMGNPGAQHELVCTLVHKNPSLVQRLAEITGDTFPYHDQVVAAPNSHQVRDGAPLTTDGTVRFLRDGNPAGFAQAEMQRRYSLDKLATLRAYHGSEVRNTKAGGVMFVLSPDSTEARKFRDADHRRQQEFAYHGRYLSREDLAPLAAADRPLAERACAAAAADFTQGVPEIAPSLLTELLEHDLTVAVLYFRTMTEECPNMTMVEEALQPDLLAKLRQMPSFGTWEAEAEARGRAEGEANALIQYFSARGDAPSVYAFSLIRGCVNADVLSNWLARAYLGEKSADIFPEPS
jgi:hypothetical protein